MNSKTTFTHAPKTVLGYRCDGRPIYTIAGGSEAAPEAPAPTSEPVISIPVAPEPPAPPRTFSAEDIAKARQEEKDKLYERLQSQEEGWKKAQEEIEGIKAAEAAKIEAAQAEARAAAEEEAKKRWEEQDAKTLLAEKDAVWQAKFASIEAERQQERVLLEKEREFLGLQSYAQQAVAQNQDRIAPELIDYISGNTQAEIDASIATAIAKTDAIVEGIQQAQQQARAGMKGVSTAGYAPTGPMDNTPGQQTFTIEELQNMSAADYAKHRGSLLGAAASQRERGLFG